ncbi:hypothetical protein Nmel_016077, partial [Mimus melanotis]
MPSVPSGLLL